MSLAGHERRLRTLQSLTFVVAVASLATRIGLEKGLSLPSYVDRTRRLVLVSRVKSPIGFEGDTGKMNTCVNLPCAENSRSMTDSSMCETLRAMRPIL
jgi:hypothetical protein